MERLKTSCLECYNLHVSLSLPLGCSRNRTEKKKRKKKVEVKRIDLEIIILSEPK